MIYVLIPTYNRYRLLKKSLDSLINDNFEEKKIIVVNDGCTDSTNDIIYQYKDMVYEVKTGGGLYWTGAINYGIKYILNIANKNDYIFLLNDDVCVEKDTLKELYHEAKKDRMAIYGCYTVDINRPNIVYSGGVKLHKYMAKLKHIERGVQLNRDTINDVDILTGRGVLYPIEAFLYGIFDDNRFKQCGDTELPVRLKKIGYSLKTFSNAIVKVRITESASINNKKYKLFDLKEYFLGLKSNMNIKYRYYFSKSYCDNKQQLVAFYISDLIRIIAHFIKNYDYKNKF